MEKQRWEESERRRAEERRSEKRKIEKKEDAGARKGSKVAKHCVFPMICGSGGSKCRLAKAAGAEPFGEIRDEQLHAIVARRCTKHISKSKCTKHTVAGALLEVEMLKGRTPLCREAHVEVKMPKPCQLRSTFRNCGVQKVHGVVARSAFGSEHAKDTTCSRHFWALKRRFVWQAQGFLHLNK